MILTETLAKAKAMVNKTFTVQASLIIVTYDHQNISIVKPAGDSIGPRFALQLLYSKKSKNVNNLEVKSN